MPGDGKTYFYTLKPGRFPQGYDRVWGKNSVQVLASRSIGVGPVQDSAHYYGLDVPFSPLIYADVVVKAGDLEAFSDGDDGELFQRAYGLLGESQDVMKIGRTCPIPKSRQGFTKTMTLSFDSTAITSFISVTI